MKRVLSSLLIVMVASTAVGVAEAKPLSPLRACPEGPVNRTLSNLFQAAASHPEFKKFTAIEPILEQSYHLPDEFIQGYYARRIEPYLSKPSYQEVKNPEVLYRGMLLTPDEVKNIFEKGMEASRVKWESAGGGISFSSNINEASNYIFTQNAKEHGVGVVFQVKKTPEMLLAEDAVLNSTRTIFKLQKDLKPEEIQKIYIWGEYGLESLDAIAKKMQSGQIKPHESWTGMFGGRGF